MASIASIETAIQDIRSGGMVILVDDEDRENEGDLVIAAEHVTAESIAFMAEHGRGLICLAMEGELLERLALPPMATDNEAPLGTAFTISVDAVDCAGSGVSAADRAHTIRRAIAGEACPEHFRSPGHVFPLRARDGGVLMRSGQTEGSVDLARLAGLAPAGVICEVMAADGTMQRLDALLAFGDKHGIGVVTVADLIEYRVHSEPLVVEEARSQMPTRFGTFDIVVFRTMVDDGVHVAMTMGEMDPERPTLARVHRANMLGDAFGLSLSHSRRNLEFALEKIAKEGCGALVHLSAVQEAGDLAAVLEGYVERTAGRPWPPGASPQTKMDFREFGVGAQILRQLGLGKLRVLTNNPVRLRAVSGFGLEIVQWLPLSDAAPAVDSAAGAPP